MGLSDVPVDQLLAWVQASTEAQGLPLKVADPATVARVRALHMPEAGGSQGNFTVPVHLRTCQFRR